MRFKGRDLERLFQMVNLCSNVQRNETSYVKEEDYEVLFVIEHRYDAQLQIERGHKKRLYFTYQGLIKVITNSRSGVAERFMHWLTHVVFTAHMGSTEARAALAFELEATDPNVIKSILARCMQKMSCIYMFEVGKMVDLKKHYPQLKDYNKGYLCKIGRSEDLFTRTGQHCNSYGNLKGANLKMVYFSPVDPRDDVDAETELKAYFGRGGRFGESKFVTFRNHTELVCLDRSERAAAREFYTDTYLKYGEYIKRYIEDNEKLRLIFNEKEKLLNERELFLAAKDETIAMANHHITSLTRQLDDVYSTANLLQEQIDQQAEEISLLKFEKLEALDRERGYRGQIIQKDELIQDITNKLAKYSRLLQENPNDRRVHEKIRKYRIKVMKLTGVTEEDLVNQMQDMRL